MSEAKVLKKRAKTNMPFRTGCSTQLEISTDRKNSSTTGPPPTQNKRIQR